MKNKIYKIFMYMVIFLIVIFTIVIMKRHEFGIDELDWTLKFVSNNNWIEMFKSLALYGYNLPLFYVIVKLVDEVFHHNEFVLLIPSALMTFVGCYYTYKSAKENFKLKFPVLILLILVSSVFFFKQIACALRPYSLLFMLSAMSYYYYFEKLNNDKLSNNLKFILSIIGLLFTHWYGALLVLCYGITDFYLLIKKKISFKRFILYIIPFILILSWCSYVFYMHTITFSKYWANTVDIFTVVLLIFQLLSFNIFSLFILKATLRMNKAKIHEILNERKIRITLYEILFIILGMIIYSNFINPKSSLWVNRYFIAFLPQISMIVAFYFEKFYFLLKENISINAIKIYIIQIVAINMLCSILLTLYLSFLSPNIENEMSYKSIFGILKEDEDIYNEDTLIICTYGKYWVDYYLFEKGEKLPSNILVIDPHKYGNTNSEKAKVSELEYMVKDYKECHQKLDINEKYNYKKIYIVELYRLLLDDELEKIIDLDNYKIKYNDKTNIAKLVRNED